MYRGFYKATCQAKVKIGFNNLPCLKYDRCKDTDEELKYEKQTEVFRRDKQV